MQNYKITKTIRFKLEANPEQTEALLNQVEKSNQAFDLVFFTSQLENFANGMRDYLMFQKGKEPEKWQFRKNFTIKKDWLKVYAKEEFANIKQKQKEEQDSQYGKKSRRQPIQLNEGEKEIIQKSLNEVYAIYQELIQDVSKELNERARRERTGLLLKRLQERKNLPLLCDLADNISDKSETTHLIHDLIIQKEQLQKELLQGIAEFLPAQSSGLPIAKATFNYYTINKKPTDYAQKIEEQLKTLSISDYSKKIQINAKSFLGNDNFKKVMEDIKNRLKKDNITHLLFGHVPSSISLGYEYASLRQILKNIKAEQKKKFNELMMEDDFTYEKLKKEQDLYLFTSISDGQFNDYLDKTRKLQDLANQLNNKSLSKEQKSALTSQKERVAKERGRLLKDKFTDWKKFMGIYRDVAQKHGKILATLKGIEKERIESQLLKYWALILKVNAQYKLVLIPRDKVQDAKKWIENHKNNKKTDKQELPQLYWFESLTFKSLQKLCWGHAETGNNEFRKNIISIIPKNKNNQPYTGEHEFEGKEQDKTNFYKKVLQDKYTRDVLHLPFAQIDKEIISKNFDTLEDFKITLEKICYRRQVIFNQDAEKTLTEQFKAQILNITSLDLSRKSNESAIKPHTQIWKNFWSDSNEKQDFDIRLNPEITITYREPKPSRVHKYGKNSQNYDEKMKNRYLYPQFILITTMSEHCNAPQKNLSFITEEELKKEIDTFNQKFREKNQIKFAIGLDNGETELSTLGIFVPDFNKNTNEERLAQLRKVQEYGFEALTIKNLNYAERDYKGKLRKMIDNPSYFLNKSLYMRTFGKTEQDYERMFAEQFEKKHLLSLDLSAAKVICGHIVTNGDTHALFNLWKRHAERLIYFANDHIKEETAKKVFIKTIKELTHAEKEKLAESISTKKYKKLTDEEKKKYLTWLFEDRNLHSFTKDEDEKFKVVLKNKGNYALGTVFYVVYLDEKLIDVKSVFDIRLIFKKREEFYSISSEEEIMTQLNGYNTNRTSHDLSNQELDLKLKTYKETIVANAIGVIDFLYKQYKQRFGGEGLIVKEGFDTEKVVDSLEKFSGNIYRILERKLYQKFQNYGLVPPIKSLLSVRSEGVKDHDKTSILKLGNVGFVSQAGTSQECPVCLEGKLHHGEKCDKCGFIATMMHSNDGIAGYNIAKRGFNNFVSQLPVKQ